MLSCPKCGESFTYGYPCIHELILKLLHSGRWKCSVCGTIVVSDCQIVQLNSNQVEALLEQTEDNKNATV